MHGQGWLLSRGEVRGARYEVRETRGEVRGARYENTLLVVKRQDETNETNETIEYKLI